MRRKSIYIGLVTSVATAVLLAGCGSDSGSSSSDSSDSPGKSITLAGVLANTSDAFWSSISCGAQEQAKQRGVTLKMYTSTSTDSNQIASNFQSASLTNPDGMMVSPFNNNQFIAQYQSLMAKGVPVVTTNGTSPQAEYKNIFSGSDTARFAPEALQTVPAGAGSMVFLGGAPGIAPLESRTLPFVDAVKAARPDLKVLPTNYSGFDINKATSAVSALILANPDLKLIIAAAGPDAVGAAAAVKQSGKQGQITLIGFDAVPAQVTALKDGTITALIAQSPLSIGRKQVDALVDYLTAHPDGGAVTPDGSETVENQLLTKETVDDPSNADFLYKTIC